MRKGTTAISAGALTLALAGGTVLLATTPAVASSPRLGACDRGDDPLSGLTEGVCGLLGGVDAVLEDPGDAARAGGTGGTDPGDGGPQEPADEPPGGLTGDALKPVTRAATDLARDALRPIGETVDDTLDLLADDALKPLADTVDTTADDILGTPDQPSASSSPAPSPAPTVTTGDPLEVTLGAGCLPAVLDCAEVTPSPTPPQAKDRSTPATAAPTPRVSRSPSQRTAAPAPGGRTATDGPRPGGPLDRATGAAPRPRVADVETPPLTPLWPGQPLPSLAGPLDARQLVPGRPYDAVGTALTAVLLVSAILATRILRARGDAGEPHSMPFEGMRRADNGRQRLA